MILRVPSPIPFLALVTSNERCWVISAKRRSGKGYAGRKMRLWDARYARHIGDEGSLRHTDLASSRRECRNSS
jgi:hypothetical protein